MRISDWSSDVCSSDLRVCELWAPLIESKVGRSLAGLEGCLEDQETYCEAVRQLIADLDIDLGFENPAEASEGDGDENADDDVQSDSNEEGGEGDGATAESGGETLASEAGDRKSTRLNSSH